MNKSLIPAAMIVLATWASVSAEHLAESQQPCLPPGMTAEFFGWPITRSVRLILSKAGNQVPGFYVVYRQADHAVAVLWTDRYLVALDPSPDTDEPVWVDTGVVTPRLTIRSVPGDLCQWTQLPALTRDARETADGDRRTEIF